MTELHLLKLPIDVRHLYSFGQKQGLLGRDVDDGYLIHAALTADLGEHAPKPFIVEESLNAAQGASTTPEKRRTVLGYTPMSISDLRQKAVGRSHSIDWENAASKPMPVLSSGAVLRFSTCVLPTVRSRSASPGHETGGRGNGRELDAFVAACLRAPGQPVDRAAVYHDWLGRELARDGASELIDYSLTRFERLRLVRKHHRDGDAARARASVERATAVVSGVLRVKDSVSFRTLLARGLGRHRSFGYGMLLLRSV